MTESKVPASTAAACVAPWKLTEICASGQTCRSYKCDLNGYNLVGQGCGTAGSAGGIPCTAAGASAIKGMGMVLSFSVVALTSLTVLKRAF